MSEQKYTPGPWAVGHSLMTADGVWVSTEYGLPPEDKMPLLVYGRRSCRQANAVLIAAAPTMLEALETVVGCAARGNDQAYIRLEALDAVIAAIAAARGGGIAVTEQLHDWTYKGPRWRYRCTLRPASIGAVPAGRIVGADKPQNPPKRYDFGTIEYGRPLTAYECGHFDLVLVAETSDDGTWTDWEAEE